MGVILVVTLLAPLVLVGIVLAVVLSLTSKGRAERPGWQPTAPAGTPSGPEGLDGPAPTGGHGVWNAQVMGGGLIGAMGGTLNARFGRFVLDGGNLSYLPDGAAQPEWTAPCRDLTVTHRGVLAAATVELNGPMGRVRCDVSVEHINRFTRNSAKSLRESRHAQEFVRALVANGARGA